MMHTCTWFGVDSLRFGVKGLGATAPNRYLQVRVEVQGSGIVVYGLGVRGWGSRVRIQGSWFRGEK